MIPIIKFHKITKSYKTQPALQDLSFEILQGQVFGIVGPNGAGKTTALKILLGLTKPDGGIVEYHHDKSFNSFLKNCGASLDKGGFDPDMTAVQNLRITCCIKKVHFSKIDEVMEVVNLINVYKKKYKDFSLGMKQRLSIAACLIGNPRFVIFDEPTNGLDPLGIIQIRTLILKLSQSGTTCLITSHYLSEMQQICSQILILNKGQSAFNGTMEEILLNYQSLEKAYMTLTQ